MGCGSSSNQIHDVSVPQNNKQKEINHQQSMGRMKNFQQCQQSQQKLNEAFNILCEGKIFLFGESATQRKILYFDFNKLQFSILSSRTRIPLPPIQYQPIQVIYQQSQELFASTLFNTNSRPPYNFMLATFIEKNVIFLCGGANFDYEYISNQTFLYYTESKNSNNSDKTGRKGFGHNLMGTQFQKLPFMIKKRYSHTGVYYCSHKLKYIFVFGGVGQNQQLLNHCQKYSFEDKKWYEMQPLSKPRVNAFSLIFKNKIYIFGGVTAQKKRSKKIQVYDPINNCWEILKIKIHRGIEAGIIFSHKSNQILLMGGNTESGAVKSVIKVNLAKQTYILDSNMKKQRCFQKGIKNENNILVFGGDYEDTMQVYSIKQSKWQDLQVRYSQYISTNNINIFTASSQTMNVKFDENQLKPIAYKNQNKYLIFGSDNYPCIIDINFEKMIIKKRPVPMSLRLCCFMGIIEIKPNIYFIYGGIDTYFQRASRKSYMYSASDNKAIQLKKMKQRRYNATHLFVNQNIYIFGGQKNKTQILKSCEKYDCKNSQWSILKDMPSQRTRSKSLLFDQNIFIYGGTNSVNKTLYNILIYNIANQQFSEFEKDIPISADIRFSFVKCVSQNDFQLIIFANNQVINEQLAYNMKVAVKGLFKNQQKQKILQQKIIEEKVIKQVQKPKYDIKIQDIQENQLVSQKCTENQILIKLKVQQKELIIKDQPQNEQKSQQKQVKIVSQTQLKQMQVKKQYNQQRIIYEQLKIKILKYQHLCHHDGKYYFITQNRVLVWDPKSQSETISIKFINQEDIQSMPIDKFSTNQ